MQLTIYLNRCVIVMESLLLSSQGTEVSKNSTSYTSVVSPQKKKKKKKKKEEKERKEK